MIQCVAGMCSIERLTEVSSCNGLKCTRVTLQNNCMGACCEGSRRPEIRGKEHEKVSLEQIAGHHLRDRDDDEHPAGRNAVPGMSDGTFAGRRQL